MGLHAFSVIVGSRIRIMDLFRLSRIGASPYFCRFLGVPRRVGLARYRILSKHTGIARRAEENTQHRTIKPFHPIAGTRQFGYQTESSGTGF